MITTASFACSDDPRVTMNEMQSSWHAVSRIDTVALQYQNSPIFYWDTYNTNLAHLDRWLVNCPTFAADCGVPSLPINNLLGTYSSTGEGANITVQCEMGYVPSSAGLATCTAGNWTPALETFTCQGTCSSHVSTQFLTCLVRGLLKYHSRSGSSVRTSITDYCIK